MSNQNEKKVAEAIWLKYFNETLFEMGLITEEVRNKMIVLINERK